MSSVRSKTLRLAPHFDWPEDGLVQIGSLIRDPSKPDEPLDRTGKRVLPVGAIDRAGVLEFQPKGGSGMKENSVLSAYRIFGDILMGAGLSLWSDRSESQLQRLKFRRLRRMTIQQTCLSTPDNWIGKTLNETAIKKFLTLNRTKVYLITEVIVAYVDQQEKRENLEVSQHLDDFDADIDIGGSKTQREAVLPKVGGLEISPSNNHNEKGFVFAYEVKQVKYGVIEHAPDNKVAGPDQTNIASDLDLGLGSQALNRRKTGPLTEVFKMKSKNNSREEGASEIYYKGLKSYEGLRGIQVSQIASLQWERFLIPREWTTS
jgi:hypothetical protein